MKRLVIVVVGALVVGGIAGPAQAAQPTAKKYRSCAALLEDYPNGVAKNKKARNAAVKAGFAKPKVSKKLYAASKKKKGRPKAFTQENLKLVRRMKAEGESVTDIAAQFGVARTTVYRALEETHP